jgi:GNAT superfamily N-acetyltransferase
MTGPETHGEPSRPIARIDDRLGLAVDRAGRSGRTLVTYARDHVTVRTPSKPDFRDGNTIDLLARPSLDGLDGWIDRFRTTIGVMGVSHVQLRWEESLPADAPPEVPSRDAGLERALAERGFTLEAVTVLLLDALSDGPRDSVAELRAVEAPSAVPGGPVDRSWHAATVLYRYLEGEDPEQWRAWDPAFTAWSVDVQRELASAGRAQVWLAARHGAPVGRLTLLHDRQGLAVVEDVVVHPVHRRLGIASALIRRAVADHLAVQPGSRVGIGADPGSPADHLYRSLGFRPHATVWTALRGG